MDGKKKEVMVVVGDGHNLDLDGMNQFTRLCDFLMGTFEGPNFKFMVSEKAAKDPNKKKPGEYDVVVVYCSGNPDDLKLGQFKGKSTLVVRGSKTAEAFTKKLKRVYEYFKNKIEEGEEYVGANGEQNSVYGAFKSAAKALATPSSATPSGFIYNAAKWAQNNQPLLEAAAKQVNEYAKQNPQITQQFQSIAQKYEDQFRGPVVPTPGNNNSLQPTFNLPQQPRIDLNTTQNDTFKRMAQARTELMYNPQRQYPPPMAGQSYPMAPMPQYPPIAISQPQTQPTFAGPNQYNQNYAQLLNIYKQSKANSMQAVAGKRLMVIDVYIPGNDISEMPKERMLLNRLPLYFMEDSFHFRFLMMKDYDSIMKGDVGLIPYVDLSDSGQKGNVQWETYSKFNARYDAPGTMMLRFRRRSSMLQYQNDYDMTADDGFSDLVLDQISSTSFTNFVNYLFELKKLLK